MKRKWVILGTLVASLLLISAAQAAPNAPSIDWWVIGGGGGSDTVSGTVGQAMTSDEPHFNLCVGFWCGAMAEYKVYLPLTLRDFQ